MIPIPPTWKFWILFALYVAAEASKRLADLQPAWSWAASVAQLLMLLEGFLTVPSGQVQLRDLKARIDALHAKIGGGVVAVLAVLSLTLSACLPARFPEDVIALYACVRTEVEAGVRDVGAIMLACKAPEEQVVIDGINSLLNSPSWVKDHPQLVRDLVRMGGRAHQTSRARGLYVRF